MDVVTICTVSLSLHFLGISRIQVEHGQQALTLVYTEHQAGAVRGEKATRTYS